MFSHFYQKFSSKEDIRQQAPTFSCLHETSFCSPFKFLPWKKLYHKLKADVGDSRQHVQSLMAANGMKFPCQFLSALTR